MRMTNEWANWLLNESTGDKPNAGLISVETAYKKLKLNDFKVNIAELKDQTADDTEFGINFYPDKKLLVKSVDDYPIINVFLKTAKSTASVDVAHESTGTHLFTVKYTDLNDLVEKLSKLDVLSGWKKYVQKIEKNGTKILKEDEDLPEEDTIDAKKALKIAKKLTKYAEKTEDEELEKLVGDLLAALGEEDESDEDESKETKKEKGSKPKKEESDEELDF